METYQIVGVSGILIFLLGCCFGITKQGSMIRILGFGLIMMGVQMNS